ncbi:AMY [Mytilus edulis]|uniref:alpha-amylase n=1 Tax=Mytilus edulis TaxID=6550 RepID=A0A8S3VQW0_MYTED|nr:AMY [Mytilus edulis]
MEIKNNLPGLQRKANQPRVLIFEVIVEGHSRDSGKLDYISGLGANAIWISPIVINTPKGYHGYWAKDIYNFNEHFGTEEDFKYLLSECHKRDIWVMVDVVANHMGYTDGCCWNVDCDKQQLVNFTGFSPFNRSEDYHSLCEIMNWKNQTEVELCRLAKLPDLNQSNQYVRSTLLNWISELTKKYGIDGYRIDTVTELSVLAIMLLFVLILGGKRLLVRIPGSCWSFLPWEASSGNITYTAEYQGPLNSILNYPLYYTMKRVFTGNQSMKTLTTTVDQEIMKFEDITVLGNFIDNHDVQRFLSISPNITMLMNNLAYVLLSQGIPIIYYGTEQAFNGGNDPENREALWPHYNQTSPLYKFISQLSHFRRRSDLDFSSDQQTEVYASDDYFILSRGDKHQVLIFITNKISDGNLTKTFPVNVYTDGTVLVNIENDKDFIEVTNRSIDVQFYKNMPKVFRLQTDTNSGDPVRVSIVMTILSALVTLGIYWVAP